MSLKNRFAQLLLVALLCGCTVSDSVTEAEKSILITEMDFAGYELEHTEITGGYEKTRYFDGSVEYAYESNDDSDGIYIYCSVAVERKSSDALVSEWANRSGVAIGFKSSGVIEVPVKLTKRFG